MIHSVAPQIFFNFKKLYPNILFFKNLFLNKVNKSENLYPQLYKMYQKF